jgi:hypothetical protein
VKIGSDLSESVATDFFLQAEFLNPGTVDMVIEGDVENGDGFMKKQRRMDVFEPVEVVGQT